MATLPSTMKAAIVVKHKSPVEIKDVPVPAVGEGQILVKIVSSGVCHTDVHVADGDLGANCPTPIILGHEGCGTVAAVGAGVTNVKLGDRVGVPWLHTACGTCYHCKDGWETVCQTQKQTGFVVDGGLAEYVLADAAFVGKIPDALTFEQAAPIMCAGVTVYKALKVSDVKPGQWVSISGAAGGLGHVAIQYAKAMGMRVIGITRAMTPEKAQMFSEYGVDYPLDLSKETVFEGVKKATGGEGPHGAVCLAPMNQDITDATSFVAPRGTVVPVAIQSGNFEANTQLTVIRAVKILGSIVGTRKDLEESLALAAEGKVKCSVTIRKFEDINNVLDELRDGKVKGRVVMNFA